jgi:hypothetical protein
MVTRVSVDVSGANLSVNLMVVIPFVFSEQQVIALPSDIAVQFYVTRGTLHVSVSSR